MTAGPIVGARLWQRVMDAADHRCQCAGQCGTSHRHDGGRCPREHGTYGRHGTAILHAAPADLALPLLTAAGLPADQLRAWCPDCHHRAATATRRARAARTSDTTTDALF